MPKPFYTTDDKKTVALSQIICQSLWNHVSRLTNHICCLLTRTNCHSKYVQHEDINGRLSLALGRSVLGETIAGVVVGRAIGVAVVVRAVAVCLALARNQKF